MVEGEFGAAFSSLRVNPAVLGVTGTDEWTVDVALRVGVTDRIQLEAGTAFSLDYTQRSPDGFQGASGFDIRASLTSWKRVVPVRLSVLALDTEALDTALALTLPFTATAERTEFFGRGGSQTFTNGNGKVVPAVLLAAPTRWRLLDWFWLRAGENLFSVTTDQSTATFEFDLGVGFQPHPIFAVTLDTRIASVSFDGDGHENTDTLADDGTFDLEGTLAPFPWFDLVGNLVLPDAGHGFDDWITRMAVRVRL
jgi:hypothetical protein